MAESFEGVKKWGLLGAPRTFILKNFFSFTTAHNSITKAVVGLKVLNKRELFWACTQES